MVCFFSYSPPNSPHLWIILWHLLHFTRICAPIRRIHGWICWCHRQTRWWICRCRPQIRWCGYWIHRISQAIGQWCRPSQFLGFPQSWTFQKWLLCAEKCERCGRYSYELFILYSSWFFLVRIHIREWSPYLSLILDCYKFGWFWFWQQMMVRR